MLGGHKEGEWTMNEKITLYCSFCGTSQHEVRKLIAGPTVFICEECIELCVYIADQELGHRSLERYVAHVCDVLDLASARELTVGDVLKDLDDSCNIREMKILEFLKTFKTVMQKKLGPYIEAKVQELQRVETSAQSELDLANAELAQAEARAHVTTQEHQVAVSEAIQARAKVESARSLLEEARKNLGLAVEFQ